jgi:Zn-finger nucleic acid-binding protein
VAPSATCPDCSAPLALTPNGSFDAWVCPAGHGLAATLSEAYERAQEDDLQQLWQLARTAGAGSRACPMCARPMASVSAPVDADEAAEGVDGDQPAHAEVPVDVCSADQLLWFDVGELDAMPADLPDPQPTAEQEAALAEIRATFGQGYEAAIESREGFTDRVAERIRWSPRAFGALRR